MQRFCVLGVVLALTLLPLWARLSPAQTSQQPAEATSAADVRYEGRKISEWIADLEGTNFPTSQTAKRALLAIGKPAAVELGKVVQQKGRETGPAIQTLTEMGPNAADAMPVLLEIAANPPGPNPPVWTWQGSMRDMVLSNARKLGWAAEQWIPVLQRVAESANETEESRERAIYSLGSMGVAAERILRRLSVHEISQIRKASASALVTLVEADGRSKIALLEEIINRDPYDANVPDFLFQLQGSVNAETPQPCTQQLKAMLRRRLAEKPDADGAYVLATIICNGLNNTDLDFIAPTNGFRNRRSREDPAESYATLAETLEICLASAPQDSEIFQRAGRSLVRLRLLQGDWAGMNAALERIGQAPIPADIRATLPAPPMVWGNLRQEWQTADESMRSGNSAIEFEFEKEGKPLAGAHVLVHRRPESTNTRGNAADPWYLAPQPLEMAPSYNAFGYRAAYRGMSRYAVSDASGKIRIEGLPAIPIVVEVLIPTSNFPETGRSWDLLMEVAKGDIRPTGSPLAGGRQDGPARQGPNGQRDARPTPASVSRQEGPAVVTLTKGETLVYPKFIVRPQLTLSMADWASVDANDFVLWWGAANGDPDFDHYEVEMMLTAPCQRPSTADGQRVIQSTTVESRETHLDVGAGGIGGQRLRPGNIYMFEVRAIDHDGKVQARLPRTRVWVPWPHRQSQPPSRSNGLITALPIYDDVFWRTSLTYGDGRGSREIRELIPEYLAKSSDRFEYEYVQLGQAWLQCLDGDKVVDGRKELERLAQTLPEGNVVRGTARSMLKQLDAGQALPRRLDFAADE